MKGPLNTVASGEALSPSEARAAMHEIMRGTAGPEQVAGFLLGVTARGPTVDEIVAFAQVMREYAIPVNVSDPSAIDLCGTGGDGAGIFNVSTAAALVCAGAGCTVAKHGNRSISSMSGSADVLEALGVETSLHAAGVEYCIETAGIGFIFAPFFHPAMKNVMPVRKALGVRTFFNLLGPLCNPAGVSRQLVGAYSSQVAEMIAGVLARLGADHVIAVHSEDGLDEVSVSASTTVFEFRRSMDLAPRMRRFEPRAAGLSLYPMQELAGSDAGTNGKIIRNVLSGGGTAAREMIALNAAHGIVVAGAAEELSEALEMAYESIDSGAALAKLEALRKASHSAPRA